ncbi:hypothetical protein DL771_010106 [Monosporascus sp. 5C6A]|nr:hypothetical protein DL771_010106 [Monosporascus sp. 5C6A]
MWNVALILEDLGEHGGAEERLREAIESYEKALGGEHLHTQRSQYSRTPLLCAPWNWHGAVVNGQTLLRLAARGGHKATVKLLLETGEVDVDSKDKDGRTPLSWAAKDGHEAVVKLLLGTGKADVNSKDKDGWTLLSWAAKGGHLTVVKRLLHEKADVNAAAAKYDGRTTLQAAAEGGHIAIVKLLLQKKAEVNATAA